MKSVFKVLIILNFISWVPFLYPSAAAPQQSVRQKFTTPKEKQEHEVELLNAACSNLNALKAELKKAAPSIVVIDTIYADALRTYLSELAQISEKGARGFKVSFAQLMVDFYIGQAHHFFSRYKYRINDLSLEKACDFLQKAFDCITAVAGSAEIKHDLNKVLSESKQRLQKIHGAVHRQFIVWLDHLDNNYNLEAWTSFTQFWHTRLVLMKTHGLLTFAIPNYGEIAQIKDEERESVPNQNETEPIVSFNDDNNRFFPAYACPLDEQCADLKFRIISDNFDKELDERVIGYYCHFKLRATGRLLALLSESQLKEHCELIELYQFTQEFFDQCDKNKLSKAVCKSSVEKIMEMVARIEFEDQVTATKDSKELSKQ